jgi:hypothetical protein
MTVFFIVTLALLLFLGNAHFSLGQYCKAAQVWQSYVEVAGGSEKAERVPSLSADARERLLIDASPPGGTSRPPATATR